LFSKFKCEALYVCLLTTERTPTLNIEWGQINPKGGGCNIDSGQNDPKATQGLKGFHNPMSGLWPFNPVLRLLCFIWNY